MTADVTVVVPTKDRVLVLRQCLVSLLAQVGVDARVVVVDDGSVIDDVTRAVAALGDPRASVLRSDVSLGPSAAISSDGWPVTLAASPVATGSPSKRAWPPIR